MMVVSKERLYTVEEFEDFIAQPTNREHLFELIHGEIVEKMPTEEHGEIALIIGSAVRAFVAKYKLGRVGVEIRHQMPEDKRNSRMPDVSFVAGNRPRVTEGGVPQMPDLAVEIKSPADSLKELREKAQYYMLNGTRLVWIVDPAKKLIVVLTPDDEQILLENEILDGGDVLPGFALPLKEIFTDPLATE
jgi:Uma2 family endonuclease